MATYESGIVGGDAFLSTWGKFRVALGRNDVSLPVMPSASNEASYFNREYTSGFRMDDDTNKWIRKPPSQERFFDVIVWNPYFAGRGVVDPEDPEVITGEIYYYYYQWNIPTLTEEMIAYLDGKEISSDGGNATIDAAFWASNGVPVADEVTDVTAVGGLVTF